MAGSYAKLSINVASQLVIASSDPKGDIPIGLVITSKRGSLEPEQFLGKALDRFKAIYGKSDLNYGKSNLYAQTLLQYATSNLTVVRAVSGSSKFAGVLVKGRIGEENLTDVKNIKIDKVVSGINGLSQNELKKYQFPVYPRDAVYSDKLIRTGNYRDKSESKDLFLTSVKGLKVGDRLAVKKGGVIGDELYTIKNIAEDSEYIIHKMQVEWVEDATSSVVDQGWYIKTDDGHSQLITNLKLDDSVADQIGDKLEVTVASSDYFPENVDSVAIYTRAGTKIGKVKVLKKDFYRENLYRVTFDRLPSEDAIVSNYVEQVKGNTEYRDVALVVPKGTGIDGNLISIEIKDSKTTKDAFVLNVYYDGLQVESFNVSMKYELNGNNVQMNVEEIVNKNSNYIQWVSNKGMVDDNNQPIRPLNSDKARWVKNPQPIYIKRDGTNGYSDIHTIEEVNVSDVEVKLNTVTGVSLGDRLVFKFPDDTQTKEYKVQVVKSGDKAIILDRPLEEEITINQNTYLAIVDKDLTKPDEDIYNGYRLFPAIELDHATPNMEDKMLKVGNDYGLVIDAGANNCKGGDDGSAITTTDLVKALHKIKDPEKYPYFFLADSGFTQSAYQVELIRQAKERVITHAFTSARLSSEYASDVVRAVSQDFANLNYSGYEFSFSTDWYYANDVDNGRTDVIMPPSLSDLLVETNAISTDGIWTASAGWRKGKYFNNGLVRPKNLAERELLYERGINASKVKKYKGVAKFSEVTGLNQDRPLQYRSIAKLAIYIVYNLQNYIEDIHFEAYDESNIADISGDIEDFLDDILSAGGIYSSKVVIGDLVNDTTVNKRKLPIYVAINGKAFFQGVTLGLEVQQGTTTTVNLDTARALTA